VKPTDYYLYPIVLRVHKKDDQPVGYRGPIQGGNDVTGQSYIQVRHWDVQVAMTLSYTEMSLHWSCCCCCRVGVVVVVAASKFVLELPRRRSFRYRHCSTQILVLVPPLVPPVAEPKLQACVVTPKLYNQIHVFL
jgi:hypothetical protein